MQNVKDGVFSGSVEKRSLNFCRVNYAGEAVKSEVRFLLGDYLRYLSGKLCSTQLAKLRGIG